MCLIACGPRVRDFRTAYSCNDIPAHTLAPQFKEKFILIFVVCGSRPPTWHPLGKFVKLFFNRLSSTVLHTRPLAPGMLEYYCACSLIAYRKRLLTSAICANPKPSCLSSRIRLHSSWVKARALSALAGDCTVSGESGGGEGLEEDGAGDNTGLFVALLPWGVASCSM